MDRISPRFFFIAGLFWALICCCTNTVSDFNRIDEYKLRVIGVSFLPRPDAGPGDTVTARAYFAGNTVTRVDQFSMTFNGFGDMNGVIFDEQPLRMVATQSWLPDSFQYSFIISDSVFLQHRSWLLDSLVSDTIARFMMQPKDSVLAMLSAMPPSRRDEMLDHIQRQALWTATLCRAYSENGASIRVFSRFSIRHNGHFPEYLSVVNNPVPLWVAAFKVARSNAMGFDPFDPVKEAIAVKTYLFNAAHPDSIDTTVVVDTGYSYFFACGIDSVRSAITGSAAPHDAATANQSFEFKWFFQNCDPVTDYIDSLILIDNKASGAFIEFRPPQNTAMRHFKVWTAAIGTGDNAFQKPVGVGVKGVAGVFKFTDAYKREMGQ